MTRLSNKIALVTGGARGIGGDIAVGLARVGATVSAADIIEPEREVFQDLLRTAKKEGLQINPIHVDVADSGSVELSCCWWVLELHSRKCGCPNIGMNWRRQE